MLLSQLFSQRERIKHSLCIYPDATRETVLETFWPAGAKFLSHRPLVLGGCELQREIYLPRRLSWTQPGHLLSWQGLTEAAFVDKGDEAGHVTGQQCCWQWGLEAGRLLTPDCCWHRGVRRADIVEIACLEGRGWGGVSIAGQLQGRRPVALLDIMLGAAVRARNKGVL